MQIPCQYVHIWYQVLSPKHIVADTLHIIFTPNHPQATKTQTQHSQTNQNPKIATFFSLHTQFPITFIQSTLAD